MKNIFNLLLVLFALVVAIPQTMAQETSNDSISAAPVLTDQHEKGHTVLCHNYWFTSAVDTAYFHALPTRSSQVAYLESLKKKEYCHGYSISLVGAHGFDAGLSAGAELAYRGHFTRYALNFNYGTRNLSGRKFDGTQALAMFYIDMNKHNHTAFRPYIGVGGGYTFFHHRDYDHDEDMYNNFTSNAVTVAGAAGVNIRLIPNVFLGIGARFYGANVHAPKNVEVLKMRTFEAVGGLTWYL